MIDSTNPRVMADNIRELSGISGSQGDAIEALQTYNTDEFDTGKKWIDGSAIYGIVLETKTPTVSTDGTFISKNIEFGGLPIFITGIAYSAAQRIPIPYNNNSNHGIKVSWNSTNGIVVWSDANSFNNFDCEIYAEYIKPSPNALNSPAPDTRFIEPEEIREEIPEEIPEENVK